ncbi:MAG TPA: YlxR family protein [Myxococcota bacterium]|nr:YlxR family protein [Myxococcota bacterium]
MDNIRTCLACRHKDDRGSLIRFVRAPDGEICFDAKACLPHRGAWLCPKEACLSKAFLKRLLFRGEKTLPVNIDLMKKGIRERLKERVLSSLGILRRMGLCEAGKDVSVRLVKQTKAPVVVMAADFAKRSLDGFKAELNGCEVNILHGPLTMLELGNCLGRPKTGVVALSKSRITDEIVLQVNRLRALGL